MKAPTNTLRSTLPLLYVLLVMSLVAVGLAKQDDCRWPYWAALGFIVVSQILFLVIPGTANLYRPIRRRRLIVPVLIASLMMCVLVGGLCLAVGELIYVEDEDWAPYAFWAIVILNWIAWSAFFLVHCQNRTSYNVLSRLTRVVLGGSLAELLVAASSHAIVSRRPGCFVGMSTMVGIIAGAYVMLWVFGPGIALVFLREKHRRQAEADVGSDTRAEQGGSSTEHGPEGGLPKERIWHMATAAAGGAIAVSVAMRVLLLDTSPSGFALTMLVGAILGLLFAAPGRRCKSGTPQVGKALVPDGRIAGVATAACVGVLLSPFGLYLVSGRFLTRRLENVLVAAIIAAISSAIIGLRSGATRAGRTAGPRPSALAYALVGLFVGGLAIPEALVVSSVDEYRDVLTQSSVKIVFYSALAGALVAGIACPVADAITRRGLVSRAASLLMKGAAAVKAWVIRPTITAVKAAASPGQRKRSLLWFLALMVPTLAVVGGLALRINSLRVTRSCHRDFPDLLDYAALPAYLALCILLFKIESRRLRTDAKVLLIVTTLLLSVGIICLAYFALMMTALGAARWV